MEHPGEERTIADMPREMIPHIGSFMCDADRKASMYSSKYKPNLDQLLMNVYETSSFCKKGLKEGFMDIIERKKIETEFVFYDNEDFVNLSPILCDYKNKNVFVYMNACKFKIENLELHSRECLSDTMRLVLQIDDLENRID
jgi:hypothetical protein